MRYLSLLTTVCLTLFSCKGTGPDVKIDPVPTSAEILSVTVPEGYDSQLVDYQVITPPAIHELPEGSAHIGNAYDITYGGNDSTDFGEDFAEITFSVDWSEIEQNDELQDIQGFYYDTASSSYTPVYSTYVDPVLQQVTLYTNHFTIFILTALEVSADNVQEAPQIISDVILDDYINTGQILDPQFIIIDEEFEYYRDRDYYIRPWTDAAAPNYSAENAATFSELGFKGSLGLATYNGGSTDYPYNQHKNYTGEDYISFQTKVDIEFFIMYDSRGGGSRLDFSQDASWLSSEGFLPCRDGTDNPYFIQTTDTVGYYSVYSKTYSAGDTVTLHGNWYGTSDTRINTNYWAILKPAGAPEGDNGLNGFIPYSLRPPQLNSLTARQGVDGVVLEWLLPADVSTIESILIRRSTLSPPAIPYEGEAPGEVQSNETSFTDGSVPVNVPVYYSLFTLDTEGTPSIPVSIGIQTDGTTVTTTPVVSSINPPTAYNITDTDMNIQIHFSKEMDPASITGDKIYLWNSGSVIPATISVAGSPSVVTLDPSTSLLDQERYYVMVDASVEDTQGVNLGAGWSSYFTTNSSSLEVDISVEIPYPETMSVSGLLPIYTLGDHLSVQAAVDAEEGNEVYQWYINGAFQDLGSTCALVLNDQGHFRIDCIAFRNGMPVAGYTDLYQVAP